MKKYKGFPSRLPGTEFQFTIRRANPKGATQLIKRERFRDRKETDKKADRVFLECLIEYFGKDQFQRGCLDAGRLSWLLGREVVSVSEDFNAKDYEAYLKLNFRYISKTFPELLN